MHLAHLLRLERHKGRSVAKVPTDATARPVRYDAVGVTTANKTEKKLT